jgi:two-component system, sensor histidine kinase and response regulator
VPAEPVPAAEPVSAGAPLAVTVDRAALDRLLETTGGDPGFLGELIDTYLADTPGQLAALHRAAEAGDVAELVRPAHSLKTNSANVGAERLSAMCRQLETAARGGTVDDAAARVAAAEAEFGAVKAELLTFRASL